MKIVIANECDLKEILELQKQCYLQEADIYNDFEIAPLTQTYESILEDFKKEIFLKAVKNEKIVGSVKGRLDNEIGKIGRLIVHRDLQNQGLGKKLMQKVEEKLSSVKRFELFTGHMSNKNLSLYKKLGYVEFNRLSVSEVLELVFLEKKNPIYMK